MLTAAMDSLGVVYYPTSGSELRVARGTTTVDGDMDFFVDMPPKRESKGQRHLSILRVRLKIIRNELIKNVVKFQSCMFSKLRIIFKRIVLSTICSQVATKTT